MKLRTIGINSKRKIKQNPGAHYHEHERHLALLGQRKATTKQDIAYYGGKIMAHDESLRVSRELKMNPQARAYVGITYQAKPKLFTSTTKPSQAKFGRQYMMIHGPFRSYTDAEKFEDRLRKKHRMNPCRKNPILGKLSSKESSAFPIAYQYGAKEIKESLTHVKAIFKTITDANKFVTWLDNRGFKYKHYQNKLGKWVVSFQEPNQYSK